MHATVTVVSDTEHDPYTCFWAELRDVPAVDAANYFIGSDNWTQVEEEPEPEAHPHSASVERDGHPPLHFIASEPAVADAASDALVKILGRGPDSVH
ncbi:MULTISPECIES: hypothetical protein [Mycobacteriaceae]|uniref:Uncharacterized protein n=1 Tax=Mycolicibacterium senegalense TaxID=1796 RepID=A0ABR5FMC8_9MYCO|nr:MULTISPECIES: hypothetical protein [Mycolicibacterium]KLI09292.1 hypothetical protein AA982_04360 [Mycolicibacterium senegalense]KLO47684.1 hypothetical protein ABW05_31380 [Mycolicibacterium senegalense]OMB85332.1 hypothetical protein A5741_18775 [Mycolicibacterium conceptionense]